MTDLAELAKINPVAASLQRVQEFNCSSLPRVEQLGADYNFTEAVAPAERLVGLFKQFPLQYLADLPPDTANQLKSYADSTYSYFNQILTFDAKTGDAYNTRSTLIQNLTGHYNSIFQSVAPLISYGASRLRDFAALEAEARASIQATKDEASQIALDLKDQRQEAVRILEDVRKVAAEHGVSQQSFYFRTESEQHDAAADQWRVQTSKLAIALGLFAVLSLFLHKIWFLAPTNNYDAIQLGISKVLIFIVIGFMLVLAARNFLAHKHNSIVNKHRSNALLTFRALVDAAGTEERRDIVLTHAAACIFSPQETGYSKGVEKTEIVPSVIQAIPKIGGTSA
jgi:hypothetical protein